LRSERGEARDARAGDRHLYRGADVLDADARDHVRRVAGGEQQCEK
jgi:hypothetical protein